MGVIPPGRVLKGRDGTGRSLYALPLRGRRGRIHVRGGRKELRRRPGSRACLLLSDRNREWTRFDRAFSQLPGNLARDADRVLTWATEFVQLGDHHDVRQALTRFQSMDDLTKDELGGGF